MCNSSDWRSSTDGPLDRSRSRCLLTDHSSGSAHGIAAIAPVKNSAGVRTVGGAMVRVAGDGSVGDRAVGALVEECHALWSYTVMERRFGEADELEALIAREGEPCTLPASRQVSVTVA